ncbi:MAG: 6-phosphogluconolactonase [Anaerolineales bacterium]|nr:6-phosphogluconolactonase [Anaerolineales bacterium]
MDNVTVFPDRDSFVAGCADTIAHIAVTAIAERGVCTLALAGGNTPRSIYEFLARTAHTRGVDWTKVQFYFGDERCVPPDDVRSNYRMARETLLDHVPASPDHVHRMRGETDPALAALDYELLLQRVFRTAQPPMFDLICLGMGDNGHTASLFPGTAVLREQTRWVAPQYVEVMQTWRVTFTLPLLNAARNIVFLVEGAGKAAMLRRVLAGPYDPDVLPAQLIQPVHGQLHWLVDVAAAAQLKGTA